MGINAITPIGNDPTSTGVYSQAARTEFRDDERRPPETAVVEDFSFWDLLDVINPLQHIPGVNRVYRDVTGDTIAPHSQVMGAALFGGPLGLMAATMNQVATGSGAGGDLTDKAMAAITGEPERPEQMVRYPHTRDAGSGHQLADAGGTPLVVSAEDTVGAPMGLVPGSTALGAAATQPPTASAAGTAATPGAGLAPDAIGTVAATAGASAGSLTMAAGGIGSTAASAPAATGGAAADAGTSSLAGLPLRQTDYGERVFFDLGGVSRRARVAGPDETPPPAETPSVPTQVNPGPTGVASVRGAGAPLSITPGVDAALRQMSGAGTDGSATVPGGPAAALGSAGPATAPATLAATPSAVTPPAPPTTGRQNPGGIAPTTHTAAPAPTDTAVAHPFMVGPNEVPTLMLQALEKYQQMGGTAGRTGT